MPRGLSPLRFLELGTELLPGMKLPQAIDSQAATNCSNSHGAKPKNLPGFQG
jgi:hypothetical protein